MDSYYVPFYADPGRDVFGGDYVVINEYYAPVPAGGVAATVPATILDDVANEPNSCQAFATLGADGLVRILHRLQTQRRRLGFPASPEDGLTYAFLNDASRMGATTVEFPSALFHQRTAPIGLRSLALINAARALAGTPNQMDAAPAGTPDTELTATTSRAVVWIPPPYVAPMLEVAASATGLTPLNLANIVIPLMEARGDHLVCTTFVNWIRIEFSQGAGVNNPLQLATPAPVVVTGQFANARFSILSADLPANFCREPGADFKALTAELAGLRQEGINKELRAVASAAEKKTPTARWESNLDNLLNLAGVATADLLPRFWLRAAASKKTTNDQRILQNSCDELAATYRTGQYSAPVITPALAQSVGRLHLVGLRNLVEDGPTVFSTCHPDSASRNDARNRALLHDSAVDCATQVSQSELVAEQRLAKKLHLPGGLLQMSQALHCWAILLRVLFGETNTVVLAYEVLLHRMEQSASLRVLGDHFDGTGGRSLSETAGLRNCFMRHIQLVYHNWATSQIHSAAPIPVSFVAVLDLLDTDSWYPNPQHLPESLRPRIPVAPRPVPALAAAAPSVTPRAARAPLAGAIAPERYEPAAIALLAPASLIAVRRSFNVNAHITAHGEPPAGMCLSFHVRGHCRPTQCSRTADHRRHNPTEDAALVAYLELAGAGTARNA